MTTMLDAPHRMSRRESVADMLASVRTAAQPVHLSVTFTADSYPTTSFMDELIRQTLVDGLASRVTMVDADEFVRALAIGAADRYAVTDRLDFA